MVAIKSTMADIVRRAREKGMSVGEIAKLADRDPSTVWRWATSRTPNFVYDDGVARLVERVEALEAEQGTPVG